MLSMPAFDMPFALGAILLIRPNVSIWFKISLDEEFLDIKIHIKAT